MRTTRTRGTSRTTTIARCAAARGARAGGARPRARIAGRTCRSLSVRGARSPAHSCVTHPRLGPTEAIPEDAPLSPSFDARRYSHSSEDHERGLEDSLISLPGKSGALGKAHTLANRIDGQCHFRVRDDLEPAKRLGHGHALPLQAAVHHALHVPHEHEVLL